MADEETGFQNVTNLKNMIVLILLIAVTALLWVAHVEFHKEQKIISEDVCMVGGFLFSVVTFVVILWLIAGKNDEVSNLCNERAYYADLVENIGDGVSLETLGEVMENAKRVNSKIEAHKRCAGDAFIGVFYSRKVAEQELIDIPELYLRDLSKEKNNTAGHEFQDIER